MSDVPTSDGTIEVLAQDVNMWVVQTAGRKFPGVVVQGDSLYALYRSAAEVQRRAAEGADAELADLSQELVEQLEARVRQYERVLAARGIALPY